MKRMLRDNVSVQGKMNTDKVVRAMTQYYISPITDVDRSPAQKVFNHHQRDFLPVAKYKTSQECVVSGQGEGHGIQERRL